VALPNRVTNDIQDLIGTTPVVRLNRMVTDADAEVVAKLELLNPARTVKDRIAAAMIDDAVQRGALRAGMTIVEPTSGNTGISLAMIAAARGYRLILTMPESMSVERRNLLASYGAELVLTPADDDMAGAVARADAIAAEDPDGMFVPRQFDNPANPEVHRASTGPELLKSCDGRIDAFVSGVGTGGTITGVGRVLKEANPDVLIVAVEPERSAVLSGGSQGVHGIQGIGAGFVPNVLDEAIYNETVTVKDEDSISTARRLSKEEGILAGISAGANVLVALQVARRLGPGKRVATVICDSGERYFSVPGFVDR
tara:strand:- start:5177 stop:6115 length:939 start_codon:yes stop_codon:yes gene_type:complete